MVTGRPLEWPDVPRRWGEKDPKQQEPEKQQEAEKEDES